MASKFYRFFKEDTAGATAVDFANASRIYRVMLVDSTYTFSHTNRYVSDVSAKEIAVSGYSRQTLAGKSIGWDSTNERTYINATAPNWASLATGATIGGLIVYEQTGGDDSTPANDRLVCFIDCTDTPTNGSPLTWNFDGTNGIGYL